MQNRQNDALTHGLQLDDIKKVFEECLRSVPFNKILTDETLSTFQLSKNQLTSMNSIFEQKLNEKDQSPTSNIDKQDPIRTESNINDFLIENKV